jgi:tRNA nucleotidyltransferase (CCA-adding enzyme)
MDTKFAVDFPDIVKERFCKIISEDKALKVTDLNINGYDLIDLGFEGKQIGDCLNYLLDQVLEEILENTKEKLLEKAKTYKSSVV